MTLDPRSLIPAGAVAVLATLVLLWQGALADRDKARRSAVEAESRTAAAAAQGALTGAAGRVLESAQARELTITVRTKEAADEVAVAAGGDAAVPADVADRWGRAIDRLRLEAAEAHGPGPDGARDVARGLPAPSAARGADGG